MSKWHQNVTDELHKLVLTSEHTENGVSDINADVHKMMLELKKMVPPKPQNLRKSDVLDPTWEDLDLNGYDTHDYDDDFGEDFDNIGLGLDEEKTIEKLKTEKQFIERPVNVVKKATIAMYEWMPDKDHANLHGEDKKTANAIKVVASTHKRKYSKEHTNKVAKASKKKTKPEEKNEGKFHDQGDAKWIVIRGQLRGHNDTLCGPAGHSW
jgi:primosomal protein N'